MPDARPTYDHREEVWVQQRAPKYTNTDDGDILEPRREPAPEDASAEYIETVGLVVMPPDGDHSTLTIAHTTVNSNHSTQFVAVDSNLVDDLISAVRSVAGEPPANGEADDEWISNLRPEDRDDSLQHIQEPYNHPDDPDGVQTMGVAVVPPQRDGGCVTITNTTSSGPLRERYVSFGPALTGSLEKSLTQIAQQAENKR